MYVLDSVKTQKSDSTSVKTFPNLSAIEQMNRHQSNTKKINTTQTGNKIDFEIYMLILITLLIEKENTGMDISILPILLSLLQ